MDFSYIKKSQRLCLNRRCRINKLRRRPISTPASIIKTYTVMAVILAILLIGLYMWWFQPPWWLASSYIVLTALSIFTIPLLYRWSGYTREDENEWFQDRGQQEHEQLLTKLNSVRQSLKSLQIREGVRQADTLTDILNDYSSVVQTRFSGKTFSPITYLNAARAVQLHVIQNLTDVVAIGHSQAGIRRTQGSANDQEPLERYIDQQRRMDELLAENNKLFTALTETAVEVANIRSINDFDRLDTLTRLVSLAEVAKNTGSS